MTSADDSAVPDYPAGLRLDGRPFLLLGAGQGIGRQTAHALRQAGAEVVCVDRDERLAHEIADEIGGIPVVADVTVRADMVRCVEAVRAAHGRIAGLVDIVGVSHMASLVDVTDDEFGATFDIVLRHVYLAIQVGGAALVADGGGVLSFVASISGLTSAPRHGPYGAAKAALMALVRTAAVELGPAGVRVNAVAPGGVLTPRMAPLLDGEIRRRTEAVVPLRRMAVPRDIANGLLFLSSDLASFVTGQILTIDGGGHISFPYDGQDLLVEG